MAAFAHLGANAELHIEASSDDGSVVVFGPELARICLAVRECGSLYVAAKDCCMAYSRSWRLIVDTERALGFDLFVRRGCRGTRLSEDGERLLDAYMEASDAIADKADLLLSAVLSGRAEGRPKPIQEG